MNIKNFPLKAVNKTCSQNPHETGQNNKVRLIARNHFIEIFFERLSSVKELMINAKIWFLYPPCYPFYVVMTNYLKLSTDPGRKLDLIPWIPAAAALSILCLLIACLAFGHAERK